MFLIFFLKMCSDLGILLSAAGFFAVEFGGHFLYMLGASVWLAVLFAFSAMLREKGWLRFLPLTAGALCFLPGGLVMADLIVIGAACLYVIWLCFLGTYVPVWDRQVEIFSFFWKILAGVLVFEAVMDLRTAAASTLPAGLITLVCCILLNRALRHEASVYRTLHFQLVNAAGLAGVGAAAVLLGSPVVLRAVGAALSWFYEHVISPILMALIWLFVELMKGFNWILQLIRKKDPEEPPVVEIPSGPVDSTDWRVVEEGRGFDIRVLYAILILLACVLLFLLLRKLAGTLRKKAAVPHREGERRMAAPPPPREELPARGPVRKIREIYRKFLRLCRSRSVDLVRSDTSLDVEKKSYTLFDPEESEALRQLYLKARYREEAEPSDAEEAARVFARIKKQLS